MGDLLSSFILSWKNILISSVSSSLLLHTNLYFGTQNLLKSSNKRGLLEEIMSLCDLCKSCVTSHGAKCQKKSQKIK